jgi:hypothetical protein
MTARLSGFASSTRYARVRGASVHAAGFARERTDVWALIGLALLISYLYFPPFQFVPTSGLDESWRFGLSWAHQLGFDWGTDIVFTFGPLFFTDGPLVTSRRDVLLAIISWVAYVGLVVALLYKAIGWTRPLLSFNRRFIVTALAAIALLVMPVASALVVMHPLVPLVIAVVIAAILWRADLLAWLAGALVGLILLHKLSDAGAVGGLAAIGMAGAFGVIGALRFGIGAAISFVIGWLVSGQPLSAILPFITGSLEVIRGYPMAMNTIDPTRYWQYPLALLVTISAVLMVNAAARHLARRARISLVLAVGWLMWVAAHEGFTRHDGHYWYFFGTLVLVSICVLVMSLSARAQKLAVFNVVIGWLIVGSIYMPLDAPIERQGSVVAASRALGIVTSGASASIYETQKTTLAGTYGITPELVAALGTARTSVDPWDISALVPTNAQWDPLPIMQVYTAYTPALDQMNAAALEARPRQILRSVPYRSIDGRLPAWDSPRYQRIVYCSYDVEFATERWQVLEPKQSRCGEREGGDTFTAAPGEEIAVPEHDAAITLVTVTPQRSILEAIFDFVAKPSPVFVTYGEASWRLAQNPAGVDLMLNLPVAHPSFNELPTHPYSTISVSRPAEIAFSFIPLSFAGSRITPGGLEPAAGSVVLDPGQGTEGAVVGVNATGATLDDGCVVMQPTGDDPQLVLRSGEGLLLGVRSTAGGPLQVFYSSTPDFTESASYSTEIDPDASYRIDLADHVGFVRVDPPATGTTTVCASLPLD